MKRLQTPLLAGALFMMSAVFADSELEQLATLIEGTFDSHLANPEQPLEQRLVDRRIRLNNSELGDVVFYQQINHREDLSVYRQRILVVSEVGGELLQHAYALLEAGKFVDAGVDAFTTLNERDLDAFMPDGCEQVWTRTADGFRGYVDPERCQIISSRSGLAREIEAENILTHDSASLVERGYDAETGEQLFGSPQGESFLLRRRPAQRNH